MASGEKLMKIYAVMENSQAYPSRLFTLVSYHGDIYLWCISTVKPQ